MTSLVTISEDYRAQNAELHQRPGYGSSGHLWLGHVLELCEAVNARSLIDYGCGKGTLGRYLKPFGIKYTPYDPATFPKRPKEPADIVVALDVLEHIEPDTLNNVLDDMHALGTKLFFAVVSTRPATKTLQDGRNAHLIVEDWWWWKKHLHNHGTRWRGVRTRQHADYFDFVGRPQKTTVTKAQINTIRGK